MWDLCSVGKCAGRGRGGDGKEEKRQDQGLV